MAIGMTILTARKAKPLVTRPLPHQGRFVLAAVRQKNRCGQGFLPSPAAPVNLTVCQPLTFFGPIPLR